jgi:hypothetical protein
VHACVKDLARNWRWQQIERIIQLFPAMRYELMCMAADQNMLWFITRASPHDNVAVWVVANELKKLFIGGGYSNHFYIRVIRLARDHGFTASPYVLSQCVRHGSRQYVLEAHKNPYVTLLTLLVCARRRLFPRCSLIWRYLVEEFIPTLETDMLVFRRLATEQLIPHDELDAAGEELLKDV